jgi:hypothetical protein
MDGGENENEAKKISYISNIRMKYESLPILIRTLDIHNEYFYDLISRVGWCAAWRGRREVINSNKRIRVVFESMCIIIGIMMIGCRAVKMSLRVIPHSRMQVTL